ncbi:hypothetical protein SAMN05216276_105811 [Streptosporangium subroseum]|uniref:Uncharacterized protein n=1 Tax=Streptosporangium subroseum TaxID=106412 RepID=A0A239NII5_9ACTN|nr:hypothetical protein [Streptosporangium subroseum]SNT54214.1 hypothetical protein SAMN05216276_105811 [Streptosporangium subroseum]
MRELALLARRMAGTSQLRDLLTDLHRQGRDERRTALHMAMAARELGFVEAVLAGPDMGLRRAALRAVRTLPIGDQAVTAALHDAPAELRLALYRTLVIARRRETAERLLPDVHARWGDREAAVLLPACGGPTVSRWLPDLAHAVTSWHALSRSHPGAVLEAADQELSAGTHVWNWWCRRGAGAALAARAEPTRMLDLLERHDLRFPRIQLPAGVLGALFEADAVRAARVLTRGLRAGWSEPPEALVKRLRSYPEAEILAVASGNPHQLVTVLRSLPPGRRVVIFDAVAEQMGGSSGLWAMPLLDSLPAERAATEARRMLAWHASVWQSPRAHLDDPSIPLELTSHLPLAEATGPLREAAFGGDPRRRGLGRSLLLRCTARVRDGATLRELLAELAGRTANEQDPLRCDLLTAIGDVAPALLDDSFAEILDRVATDAVDAPDSSQATREALRRLAGRVLRHHDPVTTPALTAWALGTYAKLVARHGADGLSAPATRVPPSHRRRWWTEPPAASYGLDRVLRRDQEHDLFAVLRPELRAARDREDFTLAMALARALGRRSWALDELQDDLRAAVRGAPESIARQAADLWLACPVEREERAVELVREDPSAMRLPAVWRMVAGRRTDLLLPSLGGVHQGRFAEGSWVPPIDGVVAGRWTPDQRDHVRAWLVSVVGDGGLPVTDQLAAIRAAGRIGGGLELLREWAAREETVPAEAAIAAMASTDSPAEALPVLLEHARGAASRVAVAALSRCCRSVTPSRLGLLLEQALTDPGGKVTLRKTAARLVERNRPPGAADLLLRVWADAGLHRDVRVAVASALLRMPEDARTLDALGTVAGRHADEPMLRMLFQVGPMEYAPSVRPGYADLMGRLLSAATLPGVRFRGAKAFGAWAHWYRGDVEPIAMAVGDPRAEGGASVLPVFLALLRTGTIGPQVLDVLTHLAAAVPDDGRAGSLETPSRDRVTAIVNELISIQRSDGRSWRYGLIRDAVDVLAAQPLLLSQAVGLGGTLLGESAEHGPVEFGDDLCSLADLLRDRPVLAAATADSAISRCFGYGAARDIGSDTVLPVARRLADRGDLAAGLFALALTRVAGQRTDWADPWRELLRDLRDAPHLEVRQEAWDTFVV